MGGWISVTHSWDAVAGFTEPKTRSGKRRVPVVGQLRDVLLAHREQTGGGESDFVFGAGNRPFRPSGVRRRSRRAWEAGNVEQAERELEPLPVILFHPARQWGSRLPR